MSPVHVGTLTGTALYTSISSALLKSVQVHRQVNEWDALTIASVSIAGIPHLDGDDLVEGSLIAMVESSTYNDSGIPTALVNTAATAVQMAAMVENCYNQCC
ncbi:hypothetical protein GGR57DRAFT_433385 [Xylariaceae sp. FL1272]|nr:hypothetical protein GGR57DRAFT_433385 [Xylariaceae sp. FL1272]